MIAARAKISRSPDCAFQVIDNHAIIVLPRDRMIHYLNETATDIWQFLSRERSVDEVIEHMADTYEAGRDELASDVRAFVEELRALNVIDVTSPQ